MLVYNMDNFFNLDIPQEKIVKNTIYKFTITNVHIILFTSVSMNVVYYDENDNIIEGKYLLMTGDDYSNYGTNDEYLIEWVKKEISS